ncbi:MAG: 3-oxoacid CoA-transferase subunit B [Clostridiales bacterium]|nr:3-oxoacid CoA-transferase subunit B [Clostridiales bacterium]
MADLKIRIAKRCAKEFKDGYVANLGIGLPTMVSSFLPEGVHITLQSENGFTGLEGACERGEEDSEIINAGGGYVKVSPRVNYFDSATSFGIIRGGHVDATVLGALEVDEKGNLANWIIPGKMYAGMGGAMDLVTGAREVVIAMLHQQLNKKTGVSKPKILKECTLPLTALGVVNIIVTEMCVIEVTKVGLVLTELHPDYTLEEVVAATEAHLIVSPDLKPYDITE